MPDASSHTPSVHPPADRVINAIRAHLAEFGIVAPLGRNGVEELLNVVADPVTIGCPTIARACLAALGAQLRCSRRRSWSSIGCSSPGTDPMRRAGGSMTVPASVRASHRSGRHHRRPEGLPVRAQLLGLHCARVDAALERGQGQARPYHQFCGLGGRRLLQVHGPALARHSVRRRSPSQRTR